MPRPTLTFPNLEFLRTHDLVRIELPTGQIAWLGSGRVTAVDPITEDERDWSPSLTSVGDTRQSLTVTSDKVQLSISNIDRIFGLLINDAETQLAGAKCYFIKYFEDITDPNNFETKIIMKGEIANVTTDNMDVSFTLVADLSVGLCVIGGQQVDSHCPLTFKSTECGWTDAQGGDATYCDKQYFSPNGCSGHNNRHRFQGIVAGGDLASPILSPGGGIGGGGHNCFVEGTEVDTLDQEVNIESIVVGDYVTSFDNEDNLSQQMVEQVFKNKSCYYYKISFTDGSRPLKVVANHPLRTIDNGWILSHHVRQGDIIIGKLEQHHIVETIELVEENVWVYNLHVAINNTYIANGKKVHNRKIDPIL